MERWLQMLALPDGCDAKQGWKWYGGLVEGSDGAMYAAPSSAAGVLRVDLATRTTSLLALPDGCDAEHWNKWHGSLVEGSDGAMYAAPCHAAGVLRLAGREAQARAKAEGGVTMSSTRRQAAEPEPEPDRAGAEEGEPPATAALRAELGERTRRVPIPKPPSFSCGSTFSAVVPTAVG